MYKCLMLWSLSLSKFNNLGDLFAVLLLLLCGGITAAWSFKAASKKSLSWWRHQIETCSALLALCEGNSPVTGEFPSQSPVTQNLDVSFDLRLHKRLSKLSRRRWFDTPSRSLWRRYIVKTHPGLTTSLLMWLPVCETASVVFWINILGKHNQIIWINDWWPLICW